MIATSCGSNTKYSTLHFTSFHFVRVLQYWLYLSPLFQNTYFKKFGVVASDDLNRRPSAPLPSRTEQINSLKNTEFDVLVIGGGATGQSMYLLGV